MWDTSSSNSKCTPPMLTRLTYDLNTDKGEVGGSSLPRPTINLPIKTRLFSLFPFLEPAPKKQFAKTFPKVLVV